MNTQDHNPFDDADDAAFNDYLSRDSAVSRRYRELHGSTVPPLLDQAVLSQARAAVSVTKRTRMLRWGTPLALAASVVVIVSLVLEPSMQREISRSAVPASAPGATAPAAAAIREEKGASSRDEQRATIPLQQQEVSAPEVAMDSLPAVSAPAEAPQAEAASLARVVAEARKQAAVSDEPIAASAPPKVEMDAPSPAPTVAIRQMANVATAPLPAPSPAPAETRPQDDKASQDMQLEEAVITGTLVRRQGGVGPRGTVPAPQARARTDAQIDAELEQSARENDPAQWLEYVRQLRREGKARLADSEWKRYLAKYPDYPVAADDLVRPR